MIELFIEGKKVDINEIFSTMLSFAIDDVKDFGAKNTTVSKTVILPGTKNNNALFGNIFDATVSNDYNSNNPNVGINFNASVSASVYVFNDNIQVMKGIAQLLKVNVDDGFIDYELAFFGELAGFAAKLGSLTLENLNFSAYDHTYSIANIVAAWSNASGGSGLYYPLIDYGRYSDIAKHSWKYNTFRPALFAKEYIDKIFEGAGYTYDCQLFNTTRFKGLIIPNSQKTLQKLTSRLINISQSTLPAVLIVNSDTTEEIAFNIDSLSNFTKIGNTYQYTGSNPLVLNLNVSLSGTYYSELVDIDINMYLNGSAVWNLTHLLATNGTTPVPWDASTTVGAPFTISLATGDIISFVADTVGSIALTYEVTADVMSIIGDSAIPQLSEVVLGETINMNVNLPKNILQKDFFSSIVKLFQLYVYEDPTKDKVLLISPFVDFFNEATSIDWSNKLDRSKPYSITPMSELNARYYEFNYKDDSDYWNDLYKKRFNQSYGSYKYDSAYEFAKETMKVELIFSGTPIVGFSGEDKVYSTILKRTGSDTAPVEENVDSNIRILQAKKVSGVASWNILAADGVSVLGSYTDYPYAGHLDDPDAPTNDLNFGVVKELFFILLSGAINVNQFNIYWSSYMAEITNKDSKLLTGTFKLNYKDVANLDFSKLIYIDGSLYRLNRIDDFNATNEDTCTCSFVKLINKIY